MALLVLLISLRIRGKGVVVVERADAIVRVGVEQVAEDVGVGGSAAAPEVPECVGEGVGDEVEFGALEAVVRAVAGRLRVGVSGGVEGLRGQ